MSQLLISHNLDLRRLRDEGYELEIRSGRLLVHGVPYVNSNREVAYGTLASELRLSGESTQSPGTHTILFTGDYPCYPDGSPIRPIQHSDSTEQLGDGLVARYSFSNKPSEGYPDYYQKLTRYITILSDQAKAVDPSVTAQSFKPIAISEELSVFHYVDTATSRAGLTGVSEKLKGWQIGIVGVGGTGSYILDLVAKTPVNGIHLFDGDPFLTHNAFRAPGAPSLSSLEARAYKVDYFSSIYSNIHRHVISHPYFIDETNVNDLRNLQFVFLCMDRNGKKGIIISTLEEYGIPFIDVGMGVELVDESKGLTGILRVTASTSNMRNHVREKNRISFSDVEGHDDYARSIQIADLNALNAALAVIKWKKLCGFYMDVVGEHNTSYAVNDNALISDDLLHAKPDDQA